MYSQIRIAQRVYGIYLPMPALFSNVKKPLKKI